MSLIGVLRLELGFSIFGLEQKLLMFFRDETFDNRQAQTIVFIGKYGWKWVVTR
jgi:hypothetical protein